MLTKDQIAVLSRKYKINETTIFREYLQVLFLSRLYALPQAKKIFFKGGTCLHLIYHAPRFSEDLDFTVELKEKSFSEFMAKFFKEFSPEEVEFKERKTITGKRFLLTARPSILPYKTFINLDFSLREKVILPQKSIIETDYPVIFTAFIHHLSKEELLAEKIRAIVTRNKGRDLYDLWFLLTQGAEIDDNLVRKKLAYYRLKKINRQQILNKIQVFSEKDFVLDMRPFVPISEREKLAKLFDFLKGYLKEKLSSNPVKTHP